MGNPEKDRKKAEVSVAKAETLYDKQDYKKSAEEFQRAAELYFELGEWKIAEQCFLYASKGFYRIEKFQNASSLQRLAANCCLLMHDFPKARDYYDVAAKSLLKTDGKNRDESAITCLTFAFLCHFIIGQQDEALAYIKRFKEELDPEIFANHMLVNLVKNLSNAIINENDQYLNQILEVYPKYKFRAAEAELINAGLLVAMCCVYFKFKLNLTKDDYLRDEILEVPCTLDCSKISKIETNSVLSHKFQSIEIKDIGIAVGDNLSVKEKPDLPLNIDTKNNPIQKVPIMFRTNFPGEGYIGPIVITVELDKKFRFFLKSETKKIKIISPKAVLGMNLLPQKTPVVNQTFPLQINISNQSEGDALEIEIEFEFPEELKMMRGTFKKTIYSLRPNENLKWEVQVKATDVGELPIKATVKFKDGDGNEKGPFTSELPLAINL